MFRIQNQASGKEQDFPNREALLIGLEGEENRCLQQLITSEFKTKGQARSNGSNQSYPNQK
ncbi:TPA: hypothetical protein ACJVKM_000598 [Streptococcus agalactiae]